jgi:16S rRNA (guanine527-N7)-methyltransferase
VREAGETLRAGLLKLRAADPDIDRLLDRAAGKAPELLERYTEEIELFNPAYGLVKVRDRRELVVKHILDSLAPLGIIYRLLRPFPAPAAIADLGSGAGLPGIPLAICLREHRFTLIERMGRRAGFLADALAVLNLQNAAVEAGEMEKAEPGRFAGAVFRALRPLDPALLKVLFRLLVPGGFLAAYKGRRTAVEAELGALNTGGEVIPCPVPFLDEERHLAVIRRGDDQEKL